MISIVLVAGEVVALRVIVILFNTCKTNQVYYVQYTEKVLKLNNYDYQKYNIITRLCTLS